MGSAPRSSLGARRLAAPAYAAARGPRHPMAWEIGWQSSRSDYSAGHVSSLFRLAGSPNSTFPRTGSEASDNSREG